MSADLKPYPAMKDSGVEWLGDVPKHWTTERLKSSMHNIVEQTTERRGAGLYVALEHVESWTGCLRHAGLDVSFDSQVKCFRSGDVLFGKLRPYLAKVTRPTSDGICVGEFLVLRPRHSNATAPYMEQQLRSKPIIDAVNSSTFGAKMPRADWQFMGGMAIALPPLPEQAAIVRFLDHADRRIRRYIRAKQQLIALLEEQKQAIIHRAVTRGLDPNVRLKPSGVEWVGQVPAHWEVRHLGRIGRFFKGGGGTKEDEREEGIPCVRYGDLYTHHRFFITASRACVAPELAATAYTPIAYGDVLFAGSGETMEEIGKSAVNLIRGPACCGGDVIVFRPSIDAEARFLGYISDCSASVHQKACIGRGFTVMHIYSSDLKYMTVAIPPVPEQAAIVSFLDRATADLDVATTSAQREASLLREYHTRFIADVVTGKLDVRAAAAGLPDEVKEPEPFDETSALIDGEEEPSDDLDAVPEEAEEV